MGEIWPGQSAWAFAYAQVDAVILNELGLRGVALLLGCR